MSIPAPPWVNPKTIITINVGSTPTIIASSIYKLEIDCLTFINLMQTSIKVFTYILREIDSVGTQCIYKQNYSIAALSDIDILENSMLTLEPGDLLYGYSDFSSNQFNSFVRCREYIEIGGS